jgi:enamine deaminase RidA (YjgF/YER057c/UK114 family)
MANPTRTATINGCEVLKIDRRPLTEIFITARQSGKEKPGELFRRIDEILRAEVAEVVKMDVFGLCSSYEKSIESLSASHGRLDWPITWVQGGGCDGQDIGGVQVYAVKGGKVETIKVEGKITGRIFKDDNARYCLLGNIHCNDTNSERDKQSQETFEGIETSLKVAGMNISDVVRTWFYNDRILEWYGPFNEIRTSFFRERGVFKGVVPASTGVGGSNPAGAATVASLLAVQATGEPVRTRKIASPLQGPALEYGSSFSRAVEVQIGALRRLFVSGTASIGPDGETKYISEPDKQIELTMSVVNAILKSRKMDFDNITRAIAYVKEPEYSQVFMAYCKKNHMPMESWIVTHNDICRQELLFEVELDAVTQLQ